MTNKNVFIDLNAEHLSEGAQMVLEQFRENARENANGSIAGIVGEVVMNLEIAQRKDDTELVETLEEVKAWIIPRIIAQIES
ncbi:hypothetical protein ACRHK7_01205 [Weissella tructae]|uniref:hypothetical protein n=1 Tax=Weissella tructae TaxID=887702 RepID=UPI003D8AEE38